MRRIPVALVTCVGLSVLAACGSDRTTSPRGIAPQSLSADVIPACNFTTMNQDAKNYLPSKDIGFTMIADMKTFYRAGVDSATRKGFDILARVADIRRLGIAIGNSTAGGTFVDDVVGCMNVGNFDQTKFLAASALSGGVFEVRGDVAAADAALAYNAGPITSPATPATLTNPVWGAEPAPGTDWTRPVGLAPFGRYLVYGYPLAGGVLSNGFELGTLPQAVGASTQLLFRVGLCVPEVKSSTAASRLIHVGAVLTGLSTTKQGTAFCSGHVVSAAANSWYRALASRVLAVFAPKSANAQSDGDTFGIGGLPSGWSPFNPNAITGSSITLSFPGLPTNAVDSTNTTVVVHAASSAFSSVPGVEVTIAIAGNSGLPAQAVLIPGAAPDGTGFTVPTDKNGNATFVVQFGKSGGYTLVATGSLSGIATQTDTSAVFNVKNK